MLELSYRFQTFLESESTLKSLSESHFLELGSYECCHSFIPKVYDGPAEERCLQEKPPPIPGNIIIIDRLTLILYIQGVAS